jgi:hypothetical protein
VKARRLALLARALLVLPGLGRRVLLAQLLRGPLALPGPVLRAVRACWRARLPGRALGCWAVRRRQVQQARRALALARWPTRRHR